MRPLVHDILMVSYTIAQAQHYVEVWRALTEHALFTETEETTEERFAAAMQELPAEDQAAVAQWSPSEWLGQITVENFTTYVDRMRNWVNTVPVFTIYVPVELPASELKDIAKLITESKGDDWLLEAKIDPNVMGGCAYILDDHYYDYSLHGRLTRHPEVMTEIFNSYEQGI